MNRDVFPEVVEKLLKDGIKKIDEHIQKVFKP